MLEPDYFYGKSDVLISYEQELEDWILQDIAMRLLKAEAMAGTTDMELYKLRQLGLHQNEIVKRLSALTQKSTAEIRRLLQDAVLTSWDDDKSTLSRLGIDAVSPLENPVVMELLDAEFKKTLGEVNNLTRSTMMQSQRDLMNMLNEAEMRVSAGVQSYSAAVCDILDQYGKTGVMVDYPTGTRRTLEAAVRMCVVTSMNQTAAQVTNHYIAEHNVEYVLVSAHLGARTQGKGQPYLAGHDNWQGRCYKISGSEPDAPNLAETTGYDIVNGTGHVLNPLGLHGYNCRHSHKPWNKSLRNPYLDENGNLKIDSEENRKVYELQQQQRAMERAIRQTKRQLLVKQAEIDGVAETDVKEMLQPEYDKLAYKLRMQNRKYNQFCADNGLRTQADRIKVAGFKREQAAKANGRATAYGHSVKTPMEKADSIGYTKRTKEEFEQTARKIKEEITQYSDRPSKWSGNINVNSEHVGNGALGAKEWSCDISLIDTADDGVIWHEMLHSCSASYYKSEVYNANEYIEEATVEWLKQQICGEKNIFNVYAYGDKTIVLQALNESFKFGTDMEFAKEIFNVPLPERYRWLENRVDERLRQSGASFEDYNDVMGFVERLKGGSNGRY
nr:MAG TPA: minor capsid protein [Caudoviricetes sp.]